MDLFHHCVDQELDLGIMPRAVEHDLGSAEFVAPVDQRDLRPKRVRKLASSMAESPPPITMIFLSAIEETVAGGARTDAVADQLLFDSRPDQRAEAPDAMITVRVSIQSPSTLMRNGRVGEIGLHHRPVDDIRRRNVRPASSCFPPGPDPLMPSGKPGKFSTSVVSDSWPPASWPADDQRLQIGSSGVDRRGVSGAARTDNDHVSHGNVGRNTG